MRRNLNKDRKKREELIVKPTVSIGTQDFEFIRKNHCFYIDKTEFIKEWWKSQNAVPHDINQGTAKPFFD